MSEIGKNYMNEEPKSTETKVKMTVYTALNKRKIYASRLTKLHETGASFIECVLAVETKINGIPREDLVNKLKSNYDKTIDIIRNLYTLNAAITRSNALTEITIGGETMTVTEALTRYDKINTEIDLLNSIAKTVGSTHADTIEERIEKLQEFISEFNEAINISNMQTEIEVCLVVDK